MTFDQEHERWNTTINTKTVIDINLHFYWNNPFTPSYMREHKEDEWNVKSNVCE